MHEDDPFKHLFDDESYKRAMKKATPKEGARSANQTARDNKVLQSFSGTLDFDIATSGKWSMAKCVDYINALCIQHGVPNKTATASAQKAAADIKNLMSAVIPAHHATRVEVMRVIRSVIENWDKFEKYYPRAAEVGFSIPYWTKAWDKIKKFQELSTQAASTELYLDKPRNTLDTFLQ